MKIESTVEERRTGASGTIFSGCFDGGFLDAGVVHQTGIAIRTEHEHTAPVDGHFGILLRRYGAEIGIDSRCLDLLRFLIS